MSDEAQVLDPKTGQPTTQQTPPPPEKKEEPKPLTKEQLDGVQRFASSFLPEKFSPPKTETAEGKKAREAKEAAARAKPKTAKPKVVPRKTEPEPALTADAIAEAAARGVASAMAPKPDDKKKDEPQPEYSADDKRTIAVLERMEKLAPEKYKGFADKYKNAKTGLKAYADKWEQEHPGQEFNEDDTEHDAWFDANEPKWDNDDWIDAVSDIKSDIKAEAVRKETNDRLSVFERKEKLREAEPEIVKAQVQPARLLWDQMGDEFKGLVSEEGVLNVEKALELKKADPTTFAVRAQAANALNVEVGELYKVMNGLIDYDPKNEVHVNIGNFAAAEEKTMAAKPMEDRLDADGKDFMPAAEYWKLSKAKREQYWTFSVRDIAALRATHLSALTRNLIAAEEKKHQEWAEARGFKRVETQANPNPPQKTEPEPEPETTDGKPNSPSTGSESRLTASRRAPGNTGSKQGYSFMDRQLGKK